MFSRRNLIRGGLATAAVALPVSTLTAQPNDKLAAVQALADELAVPVGKDVGYVVMTKLKVAEQLHAILRETR